MKKNIFAITGFSCAGKSTLIKELIEDTDHSVLRYSDVHWENVQNSGYKKGKEWIYEKGFEEYEDGALDVFIREFGKYSSRTIIVDGIFSYKCFEYLKNRRDINLVTILLEASFEQRLKRMIQREGLTMEMAMRSLKNVDWLKRECWIR